MPVQNFDPGIFSDFFETDDLGRRALFQSVFQPTRQAQQQGSELFVPTFNQFLGNLGSSLRRGQTPQSFEDFVTNDFNPQRGLAQQSQQSTPGLTSRAQFGY
mgnify:FL=1